VETYLYGHRKIYAQRFQKSRNEAVQIHFAGFSVDDEFSADRVVAEGLFYRLYDIVVVIRIFFRLSAQVISERIHVYAEYQRGRRYAYLHIESVLFSVRGRKQYAADLDRQAVLY